MSKRMIWIYSCNLCKVEYDTDEKLTTFTLAAAGGKPRGLDVCATCAEDEAWRAVVEATYPVAAEGKAPKAAPVVRATGVEPLPCEYCDRTFKNLSGLAIHQSRVHEIISPKNERARLRATAAEKAEYPCGECDRTFTRPQALSAHSKKHKGVK